MKAIVFGAGLQGSAVIYDLIKSSIVDYVVIVDIDPKKLTVYQEIGGDKTVECIVKDLSSGSQVEEAIKATNPDIVISMLPADFGVLIAKSALKASVPYVSSSYTGNLSELDDEAREKGVIILPEMGFDPGIDLLLAALAIKELDLVEGLYSYGGGIPDAPHANNPLKYKISWTLDGVLKSYKRPAKILVKGDTIKVYPPEIFSEPYVHCIDVPELGSLEAYPNGDAIRYIELFGIGASVKHMARFSLRWPGHCAKWKLFYDLGFLDDHPVEFDGVGVTPHQFMVKHLTPKLQFQEDERDLVVLRIRAWGLKDGQKKEIVTDLVDRRDLSSGLFAMNRTVGFTASIGAQMILSRQITKAGVLSPTRHIPSDIVIDQLKERGINVIRRS